MTSTLRTMGRLAVTVVVLVLVFLSVQVVVTGSISANLADSLATVTSL